MKVRAIREATPEEEMAHYYIRAYDRCKGLSCKDCPLSNPTGSGCPLDTPAYERCKAALGKVEVVEE